MRTTSTTVAALLGAVLLLAALAGCGSSATGASSAPSVAPVLATSPPPADPVCGKVPPKPVLRTASLGHGTPVSTTVCYYGEDERGRLTGHVHSGATTAPEIFEAVRTATAADPMQPCTLKHTTGRRGIFFTFADGTVTNMAASWGCHPLDEPHGRLDLGPGGWAALALTEWTAPTPPASVAPQP